MSGSHLMSKRRLEVFRRFTHDLSGLSKCIDRGNACVITDATGTQVYAIGINGGVKGGADCLCHLDGTRYTCIHAEANALAKCTSTDSDKCAICTQAPCVTCAALMVNSGVRQVYYMNSYKSEEGLKILRNAGVHVQDISNGVEAETWLDKIIGMLDANGFYSLSKQQALGKWDTAATDTIIAAGKARGYDTVITTQPASIFIEWRCMKNGRV